MTFTLPALLLGLVAFTADDPEPPKPRPKAVSAVSPDQRRTATANQRNVTVSDSQTGKVMMRIQAHKLDVIALAYAPDGKVLASADEGGLINVFDAATGKMIRSVRTAQKGAGTLAYSKDGRQLTWTVGKAVQKIDAATGKVLP